MTVTQARRVAARMGTIGTASAFEVSARARALAAEGKPIIYLQIGDPSELRAHLGVLAFSVFLVSAAEEIVWRGLVAGTHEVRVWILGWGADAEVLEPATLRDEVAAELRRAADAYGRP